MLKKISTAVAILATVITLSGCKPTVTRGSENEKVDKIALSTGLDMKDWDDALKDVTTKLEANKQKFMDYAKAHDGKLPRIAICEFRNNSASHIKTEIFRNKLEEVVLDTESFDVMDETARDILLKKVKEQASGAFNPETAVEVGKQIGIQYMFFGTVEDITERTADAKRSQYQVNVKLVEIETGRLLFKKSANASKLLE